MERFRINRVDFVAGVGGLAPEAAALVDEHLEYYDEVLLHVLMGDLLRWGVRLFESGEADLVDRLLAWVDRGLREGDEDVENAVAVSFIEDYGGFASETPEFFAIWPEGLRAEHVRQKAWYRDHSSES